MKHNPGEAERDGGPRRRSSLCPSGCGKDLRCGAARARASQQPSLSPSALRRSLRKPWPSLHSLALYATRIAKLGAETTGRSSVRKVFSCLRISSERLQDGLGTQHSEPGLVQSRIQQVLSRMTLLHSPFKHFQLPSLDGDRILRRVAEPGTEEYDMVVYDESHHVFSLPPEVAWPSAEIPLLSWHALGISLRLCKIAPVSP